MDTSDNAKGVTETKGVMEKDAELFGLEMDLADCTFCRMVTQFRKCHSLSQHAKEGETAEISWEVCKNITVKEAQTGVWRNLYYFEENSDEKEGIQGVVTGALLFLKLESFNKIKKYFTTVEWR